MISPCSKCSRQFIFIDGQEGEWSSDWVCPYCEAGHVYLRKRRWPPCRGGAIRQVIEAVEDGPYDEAPIPEVKRWLDAQPEVQP